MLPILHPTQTRPNLLNILGTLTPRNMMGPGLLNGSDASGTPLEARGEEDKFKSGLAALSIKLRASNNMAGGAASPPSSSRSLFPTASAKEGSRQGRMYRSGPSITIYGGQEAQGANKPFA